MAEPITAVLRQPFPQQVAAFRLRLGNLVPTSRWNDIMRSEHDRAFMVAGAMKADLIADLAKAVDKAVSTGTSLEEFRRDFRQIVATHGWHGWTGEGTKKGEAWRTRVIYRTNMATTYAAGRYAQLKEGGFPLWVYRHGNSRHPRPQHLAWNGLVLPVDHPFWQTHYPPSAWGCSCYVNGARSEAGARRVGGDPAKTLPPEWNRIDPKTGAPVGIDKGWDYAPGGSVAPIVSALSGKLDALPERPSIDLIQSWLSSDAFASWYDDPQGLWPLVRVSQVHADRVGAEKTVADISPETVVKQKREHPELTILDYREAQRVVSEATHVVQDGPRSLIFVLKEPGANGHVLVVKATRSGRGLFVTSFRRLSGRESRSDRELKRLINKGES